MTHFVLSFHAPSSYCSANASAPDHKDGLVKAERLAVTIQIRAFSTTETASATSSKSAVFLRFAGFRNGALKRRRMISGWVLEFQQQQQQPAARQPGGTKSTDTSWSYAFLTRKKS